MSISARADDYYERLGLSQSASESEIKKAFYAAVRLHPPEKDADNFKKIREAYDTLANQHSRSEYDLRAEHGEEVEALESEIAKFDDEDGKQRKVLLFKKLVNLAPKIGRYRNQLGLAFLGVDEYEAAVIQFKLAIQIDPKNDAYRLNLGYAFKGEESYKDAIEAFKTAIELNREDYAGYRALANLFYFELEEKADAYKTLDEAIQSDSKVGFRDFFCMQDRLWFRVFDRDESGVAREIQEMLRVASTNEEREIAAYSFYQMANQLGEWGAHKFAMKLADGCLEATSEENEYSEWYSMVSRAASLDIELDKVLGREDFPDYLKYILVASHRAAGSDEDSVEAQEYSEMIDGLPRAMSADPISPDVKWALRLIRNEYPSVWEWRKSFWEVLLELPKPTKIRLVCVACESIALADRPDVLNVAKEGVYPKDWGLECPDCLSTGPFYIERTCRTKKTKVALRSHANKVSQKTGSHPSYSSSSSSSACFIATAVYGHSDHWKVLKLRAFRDEVLMNTPLGKLFIAVYYQLSPPLAKLVRRYSWLRSVAFKVVDQGAFRFLQKSAWYRREHEAGSNKSRDL